MLFVQLFKFSDIFIVVLFSLAMPQLFLVKAIVLVYSLAVFLAYMVEPPVKEEPPPKALRYDFQHVWG